MKNLKQKFDYVKIKSSGGIDTTNRVITTDTQHHFGTNSVLQIVNSGTEYPIKVKKMLKTNLHNSVVFQFLFVDKMIKLRGQHAKTVLIHSIRDQQSEPFLSNYHRLTSQNLNVIKLSRVFK